MPLRRSVALLTLAGSLSVGGVWACSSDGQRDQNYGKDVATTYIPPEAGIRDLAAPRDAAAVDAVDAGAGETSGDTTAGDTGEDGGSDATSDGAADR
jgi:hypothetical protein